jgi:AAA domain, putative AbiEii toxin, Type IV TA system
MIAGLFEKKWRVFTANTFSWVSYKFTDGTIIKIDQTTTRRPTAQHPNRPSFRLTVVDINDNELADWKPSLADPQRAEVQVERYLPFVTRTGPDEWRHDHTGEVYDLQELLETFSDAFPDQVHARAYGGTKIPETLIEITGQIDCHLIETQRLLILRDDRPEQYYRHTRRPPSTLAIARKAQTLKDIISRELNVYATLSQSLDRSFPKRVIQYTTPLPPEDLKAHLEELDRRRSELMEAGILDTETDDPVALPAGQLEDAIARVLSVYADDNRRKLSSLADLLAKIKLFKELIDQRFITKDVRITKQNGIEVAYGDHKVPIEGLSSGEQHQLVLFFELLFEIKQNSLILIDEPELSLHVAWQKKFIGDLMKIIDLNKFDVILATHSPQLIGRWNSLVVELGDVYEGEEDEAVGDDGR